MLFSIQSYLEDSFHKRQLEDVDRYAVKLANLYLRRRPVASDAQLVKDVAGIHTAFYRRNDVGDRKVFERDLLKRLNARFDAKAVKRAGFTFPGGVAKEKAKLQRLPRRSIRKILEEFKHATESRSVDAVWQSRAAGKLRRRPEKIAQSLIAQFIMGVLSNRGGELVRELVSGTGFVDIVVRLGAVSHLVELKILKGQLEGPAQLEAYMTSERRHQGWLVIFDTRKPEKKTAIPPRQRTKAGTVNIITVDVNPVAPSRRR